MLRLLKALLRWFSVLFTAGVGVAQLGLGLVAMLTGDHNLKIDMYPFQGKELTNFLLATGVGSLIGSFGGIFGGFARYLMPVMALLQSWFFVNGNVLGGHQFNDFLDARTSFWLAGGSVANVFGSLLQLVKRK